VYFVELAPITDPLLIPSSIAESVGARAEGSRPVLETLMDHLRDREVLLVLDNFEQIIGGAPMVSELLAGASRLRVLVTSRESLHITAEQQLAVPPLDLPDPRERPAPEVLMRYEAVALFVQQATAVDPEFRLTEANAPAVAELC
jgi:predicted ATPase